MPKSFTRMTLRLLQLAIIGSLNIQVVAADSNWITWAGADPATRQMLLGDVTNTDGVRDDVDAAIKSGIPNNPLISTAVLRYARAMQEMLGAKTLNDVRWADKESYLSMECLRTRIGDARALQLRRWLDSIIIDTQIRQSTVNDNRSRIANYGRVPAESWDACVNS